MSESAIASYEEKAKQGILFGDSDLSSLYSRLTSIISAGSATQQAMKDIGLTTAYSGGVTTLSLNTDKLRSALESNPDKVKDLFSTSSTASSTTGGLMARLKSIPTRLPPMPAPAFWSTRPVPRAIPPLC